MCINSKKLSINFGHPKFGWEDEKVGEQKIGSGWKRGRIGKTIYFLSFVFGWEGGKVKGLKMFLFGWEEKWEDRKCNLYKLTHILLLKKLSS